MLRYVARLGGGGLYPSDPRAALVVDDLELDDRRAGDGDARDGIRRRRGAWRDAGGRGACSARGLVMGK